MEADMSVQLLDKTRKINKLLHNNNSSKVVFTDICEVLTEILASNVLVVSKKGKVLGVSTCEGVPEIHELLQDEVGEHIDPMLNERLLSILSTKRMLICRHLDLQLMYLRDIRRSLLRSTLQERDLELCFYTEKNPCTKLMTSF